MKSLLILIAIVFTPFSINAAEKNGFVMGPQIKNYGANVLVNRDLELEKDQKFKVAFDVGDQGKADSVNRSFNSLARFINMHVRAGVKPENIQLALVVHGKASNDVLDSRAYLKKFGKENPNSGLLNELLANNVDIYLCGQSAAYHGVAKESLHAGVKMSLSAMTAHALLQQQAYTLNPF